MADIFHGCGLVLDQCFIGVIDDSLPEALLTWQPTMLLFLGDKALSRALGRMASIRKWRGSLFMAEWPIRCKAMATFHPDALRLEYDLAAYMRFDLRRLAAESKPGPLEVPSIQVHIPVTAKEAVEAILDMAAHGRPVATDIEGYCSGMTCFSLAISPGSALSVPLAHLDGTSRWSEEEEALIIDAYRQVLEDPSVPKVLHNGLYDAFVLAWTYGIVIHNLHDDTMLKWWEAYPELKKGLAVLTSILTRHPYYKPSREDDEDGGKRLSFEDDQAAWTYCGIDSAITLECNQRLDDLLSHGQQGHYRFNMDLLPAVLFMELKGMPWDSEAAAAERQAALDEVHRLQTLIDTEGGIHVPLEDEEALAALTLAKLCGKAPRQKITTTVFTYQPLKWNGEAFVKAGKRLKEPPAEGPFEPIGKEKTISVPATAKTLAECKAYVLESNKDTYKQLIKTYETYRSLQDNAPRSTDVVGKYSGRGDNRIEHTDNTSIQASGAGAVFPSTSPEGPRHGGDDYAVSDDSIVSTYSPCPKYPSLRGHIGRLLGISLNVASTAAGGDAQQFLYDICGLAPQQKKVKGKLTEAISSDQDALVALYGKTRDIRVLWVLQQRRLLKVASDLATEVDDDGRIRSSLSLVKETGRMAASASPTGKGTNLQALNKSLRHLCLADPGCEFFQRDLEGADSWTVAAECAALGDSTMLEDLKAGLKPAKILCLLYLKGPEVNTWDRGQIKAALKETSMEAWLYPGAKAVVHGCYTYDHEVLTPDGWYPMNTAKELDKPILVVDHLVAGHAWFENPKSYYTGNYSGEMYRFEGNSLSLYVTDQHTMPYETNGNPKSITAATLFNRKSASLPTACDSIAGDDDEPYARLIAAFQADGYLRSDGRIVWHFRKSRKVFRLISLLKAAKCAFVEKLQKDGTATVTTMHKKDAARIAAYGKAAGSYLLKWKNEHLEEYLDEHAHWDGHRCEKGGFTVFAVNREHLDWIATISKLVRRGYTWSDSAISGFGSLVHKVKINRRCYADLESLYVKNKEKVENLPIICPTVSTGFILVRRNGKICVSGNSSYGMGIPTVIQTVLRNSMKKLPLRLDEAEPALLTYQQAKDLQGAFLSRYKGIEKWHQKWEKILLTSGTLNTSQGHIRRFYGRKRAFIKGRWVAEPSTLKEALSSYPQFITTYATKRALLACWTDPDNRRPDGTLRSEPIFVVHDSFLSQHRIEDAAWAEAREALWFAAPLEVAGIPFTIPTDFQRGRDWGMKD
jgi:hypothetical protein